MRAAVPGRTLRLIPSRYPPVPGFERVASAADLAAVMEVEGWTNDRLVRSRAARLPRERWVFGRPNASVVMAAFLHAGAGGTRFAGPDLGAWYAALDERTAVAEVAHHLRRELKLSGRREQTQTFRGYHADLMGLYDDLRGVGPTSDLYHPTSYRAGQRYGERLRAAGCDGVLYNSVRRAGGVNAVAFDPRNVERVTQGDHLRARVPLVGRIVVERLRDGAPPHAPARG